jgi:hypothetical protein
MSLEALLVLGAMLLLPLLERLVQQRRAGGRPAPPDRTPAPRRAADGRARPASRGERPARRPEASTPDEPVTATAGPSITGPATPPRQDPRPAPVRLTLRERAVAARDVTPPGPPDTTNRSLTRPRQLPAGIWRGRAVDLRHAIVLQTILGPCRANQPFEGPDALR